MSMSGWHSQSRKQIDWFQCFPPRRFRTSMKDSSYRSSVIPSKWAGRSACKVWWQVRIPCLFVNLPQTGIDSTNCKPVDTHQICKALNHHSNTNRKENHRKWNSWDHHLHHDFNWAWTNAETWCWEGRVSRNTDEMQQEDSWIDWIELDGWWSSICGVQHDIFCSLKPSSNGNFLSFWLLHCSIQLRELCTADRILNSLSHMIIFV